MRSVKVDPEKRLVVAQGGCLTGDIYRAAAPHGLVFAGATTSLVGIGGLTLGGGLGYLTGQHGYISIYHCQ
jgi:FAD/FMN-containing dehydrogenase